VTGACKSAVWCLVWGVSARASGATRIPAPLDCGTSSRLSWILTGWVSGPRLNCATFQWQYTYEVADAVQVRGSDTVTTGRSLVGYKWSVGTEVVANRNLIFNGRKASKEIWILFYCYSLCTITVDQPFDFAPYNSISPVCVRQVWTVW